MSIEDALRSLLSASAIRHRELLEHSQNPEVMGDHVRAGALMREIGEVAALAKLSAEVEQTEKDLAEAHELLASGADEETRALAEMEIEETVRHR